MKPMTAQEIKLVELNILKYVDKLCRDNAITYSLFAGTLIGAIRHNGFIPWDDDIDICLLRQDYEKLLTLLKNKNDYLLLDWDDNSSYYYPFAKLCDKRTHLIPLNKTIPNIEKLGVFIDIFPMDYVYEIKKERLETMKKLSFFMRLYIYSNPNTRNAIYRSYDNVFKKIAKKICTIIMCFTDSKVWKKKVIEQMTSLKKDESSAVGFLMSIYKERVILDSKGFTKPLYVEFEDAVFPIVNTYDNFLRSMYGDYMTLPPKEKRKSAHEYSFNWLD